MINLFHLMLISPHDSSWRETVDLEEMDIVPPKDLYISMGLEYWQYVQFNPLIKIYDSIANIYLDEDVEFANSEHNVRALSEYFVGCHSERFESWIEQVSAIFTSDELTLLVRVRLVLEGVPGQILN